MPINFKQSQHDSMENKNEGIRTANQMVVQDTSVSADSSIMSSSKAVNTSDMTGGRHISNYSIQTGEEFSLEFMRERANTRKSSAQNTSGNSSSSTHLSDLRNPSGFLHEELQSGSLMYSTEEHLLVTDLNRRGSKDTARSSLGDGSSQAVATGYASSVSSECSSSSIRLLCSFGGKILSRPGDGKLRYVGGDTRLIRISKGISWQDLLQKTIKIHNQPHIIKYQLPGEDLDALVSVSCDEDLQNMMEEFSILEDGDGSQKLRMFLFSTGDVSEMQFLLSSEVDSEAKYYTAVNGIASVSGSAKESSGGGLASCDTNDILPLLNFDSEAGHLTPQRVRTDSVPLSSVPTPVMPIPPFGSLSSQVYVTAETSFPSFQGQEDRRMASIVYPTDNFSNMDSRASIPLSYGNRSEYVSSMGSSIPDLSGDMISLQQGFPWPLSRGLELYDPSVPTMNSNADGGYAKTKNEVEQIQPKDNNSNAKINQYDDSVPAEEGPCLKLSQDPQQTCESAHEDNSCASSGSFVHGFAKFDPAGMNDSSREDPPSRSYRVFHSEQIPRELTESKNRLSKSDNSIASQLLPPHLQSELAPQDSFFEFVEQFNEEKLLSQVEYPSSVNPYSDTSVIANVPYHVKKFQPDLELQDPLNSKGYHAMNSNNSLNPNMEEATSNLMEEKKHHDEYEIDEFRFMMTPNLQKYDAHSAKSIDYDDKKATYADVVRHDNDTSQHTKDHSLGPEKVKVEAHLKQPSTTNMLSTQIKAINQSDGKKSLKVEGDQVEGHFKQPLSNDALSAHLKPSHGFTIKQKDSISSIMDNNPLFTQHEDSSVASSQTGLSDFDNMPQRSDILIDINDRFPPNLLSDLFFRAKIAEDSSGTSTQCNDDAIMSLKVNPDPKSWNFYRNLVQDRPTDALPMDVSLMDQDHIGYSFHPDLVVGDINANSIPSLQSGEIEKGNDVSQFSEQVFSPNVHDGGSDDLRVDGPFEKEGEGPKYEVLFLFLNVLVRIYGFITSLDYSGRGFRNWIRRLMYRQCHR